MSCISDSVCYSRVNCLLLRMYKPDEKIKKYIISRSVAQTSTYMLFLSINSYIYMKSVNPSE